MDPMNDNTIEVEQAYKIEGGEILFFDRNDSMWRPLATINQAIPIEAARWLVQYANLGSNMLEAESAA